jgi:hypothetical protein
MVGATRFEPVTSSLVSNPGSRCARSRSPRSGPTVDGEGERSLGVQADAVLRHLLRLLGLGDGPGGVDQADVAEGLGVVADHLHAAGVDLLGQQADVVGVGDRRSNVCLAAVTSRDPGSVPVMVCPRRRRVGSG